MTKSVAEFYQAAIKPLSVADRLRLATMILHDIPSEAVVDVPYDVEDDKETERTAWHAFSLHALSRIADDPIDNMVWDDPPPRNQNKPG